MNKIKLYLIFISAILICNGCTRGYFKSYYYDPKYKAFLDTTQSYTIGEMHLEDPVLIFNNNYGPKLIVEEKNLKAILSDKNYINRLDVFLYNNLYGFYSDYPFKKNKDLSKYSSYIFSDSNLLVNPQLIKIYDNLNGFSVFKFQCDTLKPKSELRFVLGFISINRHNSLNSGEGNYRFKSDNFNIEYRKIIYPFCVYKKEY
jgi:hypothetical protein